MSTERCYRIAFFGAAMLLISTILIYVNCRVNTDQSSSIVLSPQLRHAPSTEVWISIRLCLGLYVWLNILACSKPQSKSACSMSRLNTELVIISVVLGQCLHLFVPLRPLNPSLIGPTTLCARAEWGIFWPLVQCANTQWTVDSLCPASQSQWPGQDVWLTIQEMIADTWNQTRILPWATVGLYFWLL